MKRIQFNISEESLKHLDELKDRAGMQSRADVIKSALQVFEYALMRTEKNKTLILTCDEIKVSFGINPPP